VNLHIWPAHWQFGSVELPHCYRVAQVAFWAEVALVQKSALESAVESAVCVGWVEVHLFLSMSSVSVDCLPCHEGKEGIHPFDFDEASPGVLLSQPSPFYALETQYPASSLLGLRCGVS